MKHDWNFLRRDRLKHLGCGFAIAWISLLALDGLIAAALCGAAAEYKDKAYGTIWDWCDLAATILGGAAAFGIRLLIGI